MAVTEKEIHIRSLSGESTTISIPSNSSIQDLKLLLKLIFLPAKTSPNFHLYFKGDKLNPASSLSSYTLQKKDFMVLVPYTKKNDNNKPQVSGEWSTTTSKGSTASVVTDAVWSDLRRDLSSLYESVESDGENDLYVYSSNRDGRDEIQDRLMNDVIGSVEIGYEKIARVSDSVNCMCDEKTMKCLSAEMLECYNVKLCRCPIWLKKLLKVFSFLNVFAGFLQMQRLDVSWDRVKGAMKKLGAYGVEISVEDVKHLSVICPQANKLTNFLGYNSILYTRESTLRNDDAFILQKVVWIGDSEREPISSADAINIIGSVDVADQSDPTNYTWAGVKQYSSSSVVNKIKKRKIKFKGDLWQAVEISMRKRKSGNVRKMLPSLEDLLLLMKDSDIAAKCGETKHVRINSCGASRCGETKHAKTSSCGASHTPSGKKYCCNTDPLSPAEMVEHLRKGTRYNGQIVHVEEIAARNAIHVDIPKELSEDTRSALKRIGVSKLYCHQAESIQASLYGKNVTIATMTSSGKSLCYNVPVLESLSQSFSSCALYIFPTKALAQNQIRALSEMTKGMDSNFNMGVYDGDTPQADRMWLRDNARLLITNPDMLHMSILPFHSQFRRILSNLRYIVIDEAHTYKGAFGCHTAFILRRLRRICSHVYGSDPTFTFCTATSANPREHAMELAGLSELDLIQNDGSPSGSKLFVLWNPPYDKHPCSPLKEISRLFAEMVQHGLRCIAFCKTRKHCELVLSDTREILQETAPLLADSICSYRGGYMAEERRRIESDFFGGKLRGVAATNALELGIDVGYIDATLHFGFPGSVSSLWQQAGRSGRRARPSLAVYVAYESPLDQYFMRFPQKLFGRPIECCLVDAKNKQVLEQHLKCAAVEHPLSLLHDERYFGSGVDSSITALTRKGYLSSPCHSSSDRIWSYIGPEKRPAYGISIRAIDTEKYKVIDKKRDKVIEEIEEGRAFFQVYEGAVYMQQGKTYLVHDLNVFDKIAICEEAVVKYYTRTSDYTEVDVASDIAYQVGQYSQTAQASSCKITTKWFGFSRIDRSNNDIIEKLPLSLPDYTYETQAVWIRIPEAIIATTRGQNIPFEEGLHAAGHAVLNVVPLFIQCNSADLSSECAIPFVPQIFSGHEGTNFAHLRCSVPQRILLYDKHAGGSGVSVQVQPHFRKLLVAGLELVTSCRCLEEKGCPSCVQVLSCPAHNLSLHKNAAIMILKGMIEFTADSSVEVCNPSQREDDNDDEDNSMKDRNSPRPKGTPLPKESHASNASLSRHNDSCDLSPKYSTVESFDPSRQEDDNDNQYGVMEDLKPQLPKGTPLPKGTHASRHNDSFDLTPKYSTVESCDPSQWEDNDDEDDNMEDRKLPLPRGTPLSRGTLASKAGPSRHNKSFGMTSGVICISSDGDNDNRFPTRACSPVYISDSE